MLRATSSLVTLRLGGVDPALSDADELSRLERAGDDRHSSTDEADCYAMPHGRRVLSQRCVMAEAGMKCAHPSCQCVVPAHGPHGKYCSNHCKQAGDKIELFEGGAA